MGNVAQTQLVQCKVSVWKPCNLKLPKSGSNVSS